MKWTDIGIKTMKNTSLSKLFACLVVGISTTSCVAQDYEAWAEQMTCGEAQYKLVSICKPSNAEMELNECKAQTLEIVTKGRIRKVKLPELSKFSLRIYKEVKGNVSELFVTNWGCGHDGKMSVLSLYYSIGGGSAPYSESASYYSNDGKLVEDEKNPKYDKAIRDAEKQMKSVHSIMPD